MPPAGCARCDVHYPLAASTGCPFDFARAWFQTGRLTPCALTATALVPPDRRPGGCLRSCLFAIAAAAGARHSSLLRTRWAFSVSAGPTATDVTVVRVIQSLVHRRQGGWVVDELVATYPWFLDATDQLLLGTPQRCRDAWGSGSARGRSQSLAHLAAALAAVMACGRQSCAWRVDQTTPTGGARCGSRSPPAVPSLAPIAPVAAATSGAPGAWGHPPPPVHSCACCRWPHRRGPRAAAISIPAMTPACGSSPCPPPLLQGPRRPPPMPASAVAAASVYYG